MLDLGQNDRTVLHHHRELVTFNQLKFFESKVFKIEFDFVVLVNLGPGRAFDVHPFDFVKVAIIAHQLQDVLLKRLLVGNPKLFHDFAGRVIVLDALSKQRRIVFRLKLHSLGRLIFLLRHNKSPCWFCISKYLSVALETTIRKQSKLTEKFLVYSKALIKHTK